MTAVVPTFAAAPVLTTKRMRLRKPDAGDMAAYTAYCTGPRTKFAGGPFSEVQAFEKLCEMAGQWVMRGYGRYVMELDGRAIGHVGPLHVDSSQLPEFTWTLWDGTLEGQGYPTEAAIEVRRHLFNDLGWSEMIVRIMPDNKGSRRIAEKIGATLTDEPAPAWFAGCLTYRLDAKVSA